MTSIPYETAVDPRRLPFKDRRTSLKVLGVLLILFGSFSACFGILAPAGMFAAATFAPRVSPASAPATTAPAATAPVMRAATPMEMDYRTMALAAATYLIMAGVLIWLGVGSLRVRRWVRPVMLVVGWTWLATGVVSLAHWAVFGSNMREMMTASWQPGTPQPPRGVVYAVTAVMGAVTFAVLVAAPALLVWLYQRRGVRETVQYFDPRFRWTDRCPTPVLAVVLWLVLAGLGSAVYSVYAILPLYGRFVTGPAAVAGLLALSAAFLWLAWGAYRLKSAAWWGSALLWTLWAGSMVWTFTSLGYHEFYRRAGYSAHDIDMMMRYSGQFEDSTVWLIALWSVALVAYLLYVRKYFVAGPPPEPGTQPAAVSPPAPAP